MVEYETKREKYTVGEFYKWNKGKLPQIVMATQSFGGNTEAEAFEYIQVIRINSVCRSERVSAVQPKQQGTQECTYSFPVDSTILFCLDGNLNQNERLSLAEILRKSTLPVDVHFAKKGIITIGDNTFSTSHFSTLRLTNVSEEIYLLGNYIFDEELDLKIVQIPIILSTIKFSEVTGLKGKTASEWKTFQRKLDRIAAQLNFDVVSGNPSKEISKSRTDGANKEDDIDEVDYLQYENCQPSMHTHIKKSKANVQVTHIDTDNSEDNTYEFMGPVFLDRVSKHISTIGQTENKPNETKQMNQRKSTHTLGQADYLLPNFVGKLSGFSEKGSAPREMTDSSAITQLVGPKSKHSSQAGAMKCPQKEQITTNRVSCIAVGDFPRPELPLPTACKLSGTKREPILSTSFLDSYENIHFTVVCPTSNAKPNEFSIMKGKEKSHGTAFQKTLKEGAILCDVDTEYGNLAKDKLHAARMESDDEGEKHSSLDYENSGEIRGTNLTSLSETASDDNGGLYETMMISPESSCPGFIKQ